MIEGGGKEVMEEEGAELVTMDDASRVLCMTSTMRLSVELIAFEMMTGLRLGSFVLRFDEDRLEVGGCISVANLASYLRLRLWLASLSVVTELMETSRR